MKQWKIPFVGAGVVFCAGCVYRPHRALAPVPAPQVAIAAPVVMGPVIRLPAAAAPDFSDDADTASLRQALQASSRYYQSLPPENLFTLGTDTYCAKDMADSTEAMIHLLDQSQTPGEWLTKVRDQFVVYQSTGADARHSVTFSSYYEPMISARKKKSRTYRFPIYRRPADLLDVDLGTFDAGLQGKRITGRAQGKNLVPYYTRAEIDAHHLLAKRHLVIAWAKDPLDIFFLQTEGTGWLDFGHGRRVRIRYDGDNGRRYRSVGRYLIDSGKVTGGLSHAEFVRYMRAHSKARQAILNVDERYVFFRIDRSTASAFAYGNIEVPLTPGRTIATDPKFFPKGALAWISTQKPVFESSGLQAPGSERPLEAAGSEQSPPGAKSLEPLVVSTAPLTRFVLNQDEGGAIKGAGRVDFFVGHGPEAERFATHFWQPGQLYFLVKKKN
jgi:membrane-bound lytic murein transglycosylase A